MYEIQYAFSLANGRSLGRKEISDLDDLGCSEAEFAEKMVKEIMNQDFVYFTNPNQTGSIGINIHNLAGLEIDIKKIPKLKEEEE